jgi:hypothetical protein
MKNLLSLVLLGEFFVGFRLPSEAWQPEAYEKLRLLVDVYG